MNNEQEMQFADPAWQPRVTREFEPLAPPPPGTSGSGADATNAQTQAGEADYDDYAHGYRMHTTQTTGRESPSQSSQQQTQPPPLMGQQPPFQGQPPQPMAQQLQSLFRRLPAWAWWLIGIVAVGTIVQSDYAQSGPVGAFFGLVLVGALALVGWLLWTRRVRISLAGETRAAETRTFTVGAQPTIILKNSTGMINLRTGKEGEVSITTTRRGHLFSPYLDNEVQINYHQNSASNTVKANVGKWRLFGKNMVTFDVTVPPQANLQLKTSFGRISVQDVSGQMTLRTGAGAIEATGVTLQGQSRLKGDMGSIIFSGSLDPGGSYEMATSFGSVNATLPADASFSLVAKTDLGAVTTNLPLSQPQHNKLFGNIGNGPYYPWLKLKSDLGSVEIHRQ